MAALGLLILTALYFTPLIVALVRSHHNALSIGVINFFLGWTFVGWVVALAMACGATQKSPVTIVQHLGGPGSTAVTGGAAGFCVSCGSALLPGASFCGSCGAPRSAASGATSPSTPADPSPGRAAPDLTLPPPPERPGGGAASA